jgi:hypothetical protein
MGGAGFRREHSLRVQRGEPTEGVDGLFRMARTIVEIAGLHCTGS